MYKNLINIKNLLRIVISLFVIASLVKSCVKAYTGEEVVNYVNDTGTLL